MGAGARGCGFQREGGGWTKEMEVTGGQRCQRKSEKGERRWAGVCCGHARPRPKRKERGTRGLRGRNWARKAEMRKREREKGFSLLFFQTDFQSSFSNGI